MESENEYKFPLYISVFTVFAPDSAYIELILELNKSSVFGLDPPAILTPTYEDLFELDSILNNPAPAVSVRYCTEP